MIDPVKGMVEALIALDALYENDGVDPMYCSPRLAKEMATTSKRAWEVISKYQDVLKTEPFIKYVKQIEEEMN